MTKRQRATGDGSIYQDASGRWRASIDLGYINGKRKRKQFGAKTRKEVAEKLKAALKNQESGMDLAAETQTVEGFLNRWLDTAVAPVRKPTTTASYRQMVRLHLIPAIGQIRLDRLTGEHVQAALNVLQLEGLAPRTVQYVRAILRTALAQAVKWGYVARNVAEGADVPQPMKYRIIPLSVEQAKKLLAAVAGHRLEVLYRIALGLGLRRGEVLGLRWSDVDLEGRIIRITGQVQTIKGKTMRMPSPKTQAGVREIPLPAVLVDALRRHWELQQQERSVVDIPWEDYDLVFPSNRGTPIQPRNLIRHFKGALTAAGLPGTVRFHDLRHSCASILIAQGVPLKTVSDILGHSSIQITSDIYGHTMDDAKRSATERMGRLFEADEAGGEDKDAGENEAEVGG